MNMYDKFVLYANIFTARHVGPKEYKCNFCRQKFVRHLPYRDAKPEPDSFISHLEIVGSNIDKFSCPYCFATDRERNMLRFFEVLSIPEQFIEGKRILYIAPEKNFRTYLMSCQPLEVIEGDLFPKENQIRVDLEDIQFDSDHFDLVICNHVLEHVRDVDLCLREIRRVLKGGGGLLAQTPFSAILSETLEIKEAWGNPNFCEAAHGQVDHLRVFGKDFISFIERHGFSLFCDMSDFCGDHEDSKALGVNLAEPFLLFINS